MPDIKVTTDVAGRVCNVPICLGARVSEGDEIAFVEAMKMEIPVTAPASGTLTSLSIAVDDAVVEGEVVAIIAT